MRISDWSSDVCSSDLIVWLQASGDRRGGGLVALGPIPSRRGEGCDARICRGWLAQAIICGAVGETAAQAIAQSIMPPDGLSGPDSLSRDVSCRSEEHTSELQSLMRISYAVFCLKKKTNMT